MSEEPVKRSTRGKRIDVTKLAELEAEQDEFWGKGGQGGDLFAEESDDESFDTSEEESENKEDSEDSDIDNPENEKAEAVEVNENEDKDDAPKKKKNVYVDPARMKNKPAKPKPSTSTTSEGPTSEAGTAEETEAPRRGRKRKLLDGESEQQEGGEVNDGDEPAKKKQKKDDDARQLRKSTVQKSEEGKIIRQIEKDEADQRRKKRKQNKKVVKQFSQAELLAEARETEKINQESLAEMMKLEEERKKIVAPKAKILGPRIITLSRAKSHTVTFTDVDDLPAFLRAKAPPYPNQAMCVITGLPAKYFDPVTQMPYATSEAFKQLRAKYVK